ncbi:MAG: hypothetical protein WBD81_18350 [Collimonas pratensis]|uniref:hypothetical protein n=1 Tax=Collimonas pratensis TaxID=279113 RepID=UPI003C77234D
MRNRLKSVLKALPFIAILVLITNPEVRVLTFLADAIGLDLIAVLFALQLGSLRGYAMNFVIVPAYRFLCGVSRLPCFVPSWTSVKQMPSLLLHAFPIRPMAFCLAVIVIATHAALGLPI